MEGNVMQHQLLPNGPQGLTRGIIQINDMNVMTQNQH